MADNYNSRWTGEQIDEAVDLARQGSIITGAEATTLAAGSAATASMENNVLKIGVPKGDKGDKGDPGYTPQKGVDYFDGEPGATGPAYTLNDTDKNTIAAAVRSTMTAADVGAGTFAGQVVANASGQAAGTSLLRNSKLVATETNPTVEGEIVWVYK